VINPRVGGSHGDLAQALALAVFEHDRRGIARGTGGWRQKPAPMIANLRDVEKACGTSEPRRTKRWYDSQAGGIAGRIF
jgi:hypothetical protein